VIGRVDLQDRAHQWGLSEETVEKDYVLGWVLWGISTEPRLSDGWAFKGGTCLKKCYIETYRFSEDLDFTVLPGGPISADELGPLIQGMLARVYDQSGIDFSRNAPMLKPEQSGKYTEGRVYYTGPRSAPQVGKIKLDLSASEVVARPTVLRPIKHNFPDALPAPASVRSYSFEEVFAEKIRAMGERGRPRDLYDIVNLYRRSDLRREPQLVRAVLIDKCRTKNIEVPTYAAIESSTIYAELDAEWANMLKHQLPVLPPLEAFWGELPNIFAWLDGTAQPIELEAIPAQPGEDVDQEWRPPSTAWTSGVGVPFETVRFAAANRLCVELHYRGTSRVVEPYSLRRTRSGNLLLYAVKADTRETGSYRVDRIEGVRVTTRTFRPIYQVEFAEAGPLSAPPIVRARRVSHVRPGTGRPAYIIECPYCGKQFRRTTRNLTLNAHKDPSGWACSGGGRRGDLVDTLYD
jgi:predicted nucleotidyltransferase component of viral defense system